MPPMELWEYLAEYTLTLHAVPWPRDCHISTLANGSFVLFIGYHRDAYISECIADI